MNPTDPQEHRIGRFRFLLPRALAVRGRSQGLYRADVGTVDIAPGGADAWWTARLAGLRAGKRPPGVADIVIRPLALGPGVQGVLYHANAETAVLQTVLAMKAFDDHLLFVARQTEAGGVPQIEKLVRGVVDAYVPGGREGFDVGRGCITSVPGVNEESRVALRHAALPDVELDFETHTVREPEKTDPLADIEHDRQRLSAGGGSLTVLRNQPRRAAGLDGMEGRLLVRQKAAAGAAGLLRFSWSHPGLAGQALAPAIMIVATARPQDQAALEAAWDLMLGSLQPLPPARR